jgi:hypothetical protein
MRLRARVQYTSSTLIGGKGKAGTSSLHTTLEGPTKYVNARWMQSLHEVLHGIKWTMVHGHLDCFKKPPLGSRPNTKPRDYGTLNAHKPSSYSTLSCVALPAWIEIRRNSIWLRARLHMASHYITWGPMTTLHEFGGVVGRHTVVGGCRHNVMGACRLLAGVWSCEVVKWPSSVVWGGGG